MRNSSKFLSLVAALAVSASLMGSSCSDKKYNTYVTNVVGSQTEGEAFAEDSGTGTLGDPAVASSLLQVNKDVGATDSGYQRSNIANESADGGVPTFEVPVNVGAILAAAEASGETGLDDAYNQASQIGTVGGSGGNGELSDAERLAAFFDAQGRSRFALESSGGPLGTETVDINLTLSANGFVIVRVMVQSNSLTRLSVLVLDRKRARRSPSIKFTVRHVPEAPAAVTFFSQARVTATRTASTGNSTATFDVDGGHASARYAPVTVIVKSPAGEELTYTAFADAYGEFSVSATLTVSNTSDSVKNYVFTYEAWYSKVVGGESLESVHARGQVTFSVVSSSQRPTFGTTTVGTIDRFKTSQDLSFTVSHPTSSSTSDNTTLVVTVRHSGSGTNKVYRQLFTASGTITVSVVFGEGINTVEVYVLALRSSQLYAGDVVTVSVNITVPFDDSTPLVLLPVPSTVNFQTTSVEVSGTTSPNAYVYFEFPVYNGSTSVHANGASDEAYANADFSGAVAGGDPYTGGTALTGVDYSHTFEDGTSQPSSVYLLTTFSATSASNPGSFAVQASSSGNFNVSISLDSMATGGAESDTNTTFTVMARDVTTGLESDSITKTVMVDTNSATPALYTGNVLSMIAVDTATSSTSSFAGTAALGVSGTAPFTFVVTGRTDSRSGGYTVVVRVDTRVPGAAAGVVQTNTSVGYANENSAGSSTNFSVDFDVIEGFNTVLVYLIDQNGVSGTVAYTSGTPSGLVPTGSTAHSTSGGFRSVWFDNDASATYSGITGTTAIPTSHSD
ncbi:MAG: hypothetical protein NUW37_10270 [Planctomycetes bacterium]|nr:hypothetical protein [Planctomycetota bacterium]